MSRAKILFINPNPRKMSLIAPVVSHFYSIFKNSGMEMKFFDTTFYDVSDRYTDADVKNAAKLRHVEFQNEVEIFTKSERKNYHNLLREFRNEVEEFQPDIIMASAMESTVELAFEMLSHVRDLGVFHMLGGVFATYASELAISYPEVDAIYVGEGDHYIVEIVERVKNGKSLSGLPGVWLKKKNGDIERNRLAPPVSLDEIPPFSIEPFDERRFYRAMAGKVYRMFPVETHRGCPLKCTFCNSPLQQATYLEQTGSKYYRSRSVEHVIKDIRYFAEECGAEYFFFWSDNLLAASRKWIDEFCEAYSEYKLPFYCLSYPTHVDEHKIKSLLNVGMARLGMGMEHGNEKFRSEVIDRHYANDKVLEKVKILQRLGVQYSLDNMIGFPLETPELHQDTLLLAREIAPHTTGCSIFTPFHGTPMRQMAIDLGFLDDTDALAPPTAEDFSILDMPLFPKELIAGKSRTFNLYLKFPENRWKDIEKAERLTPEGNRIWGELKQEYAEKYAPE